MNADLSAKNGRHRQEAGRQERLAQALRDNLRRRKEQARAQRQQRPQPSASERLPPG